MRAVATPVAVVARPIRTAPIARRSPTPSTPKPAPKRHSAAVKQQQAGHGPVTVVTRTVRDIAHEIPHWAKALMVALAALLGLAALLILAAALRNRRLRAVTARLADEVGTLSAALLPVIPARVGELSASVAYRPAAGLAAGGDFYDVFPLDRGRVGVLVGDVSGHGRESLGPATFIRHMVRSYLEAGLAPRAALQLAGRVVEVQDREDFATVIAAVHDPAAGTLSYASAGHPPPVISGLGAHEPLVVASSPPIGVDSPTGLRQTTIPVAPGSTICFFTDGLSEARKDGKLLGLSRVERFVRELPADADAARLIAAVEHEADTLPDDVAVCLLRVEGGVQSASTVRVEEIEVTRAELSDPRLQRFLAAAGIAPDEIEQILRAAQRQASTQRSLVLRVRRADQRSGVDILEAVAPQAA